MCGKRTEEWMQHTVISRASSPSRPSDILLRVLNLSGTALPTRDEGRLRRDAKIHWLDRRSETDNLHIFFLATVTVARFVDNIVSLSAFARADWWGRNNLLDDVEEPAIWCLHGNKEARCLSRFEPGLSQKLETFPSELGRGRLAPSTSTFVALFFFFPPGSHILRKLSF